MLIPLGDNVDRRSFPIVPIVLILLNATVFSFQCRILADDNEEMEATMEFFETWGLVPAQLAAGQVVGLFTHMFMHGDFMHLLGNMFMLWAYSCTLEVGLGRKFFLAFYLVWGLLAGVAHAASDFQSEIPLVGASGAISGLIGAYTVAYGPLTKIKTMLFILYRPFFFQIPAGAFGIGWFGLQLWNASWDPETMGGVAWYAHIGGFTAGALMMLCMRNQMENQLVKDWKGDLTFEDQSAQVEEEEQYLDGTEEFEMPESCPYCGSEMDESQRVGGNLARCSEERCQRLVYLSEFATIA